MIDDSKFEHIAEDIMSGKRVVVFCDTQIDADRSYNAVRGSLVWLYDTKPTGSKSKRHIECSGGSCLFVLGDRDSRGARADAVYLSSRADYQLWFKRFSEACGDGGQ